MDQLTIIVKWLGENQAALLAAIATLTAVAPAIVGLWHSLKRANQALDTAVSGVEDAEPWASKRVKEKIHKRHALMPPGAARKLTRAIEKLKGR